MKAEIRAGTLWAANAMSEALAGMDPAMLDTDDPRTLGGLLFQAEIVYDVNGDGSFDGIIGGPDEAYNVLMFVSGDGAVGPQWCMGDSNCSGGAPEFGDIEYFVAALTSEQSWIDYHRTHGQMFDPPPCPYLVNDMNGYLPGGMPGVEFSDIPEFVAQIGQQCIPYQY